MDILYAIHKDKNGKYLYPYRPPIIHQVFEWPLSLIARITTLARYHIVAQDITFSLEAPKFREFEKSSLKGTTLWSINNGHHRKWFYILAGGVDQKSVITAFVPYFYRHQNKK